ncbi:MAG TPA: flagellar assembly protein FliW [Chloroflexota bacterium]|nr:flagellar assembly protein FliW [Chloroflexota bacterium]
MITFSKEATEKIAVDSRQIVTFNSGLIGLPQLKVFALIEDEESLPIRLLQCVSTPEFVFIVINPFTIYPNYDVEISDEDAAELGVASAADVLVLAIVTVPEDIRFVTANLLSPIVINMRNKRAKQILLSDTDYPINYRVLRDAPVERRSGRLQVAS